MYPIVTKQQMHRFSEIRCKQSNNSNNQELTSNMADYNSMDENIIVILKNFGWAEDLRIPIANDRNKILELEVENIFQKKIELATRVKCYQDNAKNMKYYFQSVGEQRHRYEELHAICKEQQAVEKYLYECTRKEKESRMAEKVHLSKQNARLCDDNQHLRAECEKMKGNTDNGEKNIDWSRELEELCLECINNGDELVNALQKCKARNNDEFEAVQSVRLSLGNEAYEYRSFFRQEFQRVIELERSLRKLTELHRQMRKKRIWLITQWQSIIKVIKARDDEMEQFVTEIASLSEINATLKNNTVERKCFLDEQLRNNILTEIDIRQNQVLLSKQRIFEQNLYGKLEILSSTIIDQRKELFSSKEEISHKRILLTEIKKNVIKEKNVQHCLAAKKQQTKEKCFITKSLAINIQQRIKTLVEILKDIGRKRNEISQKYRTFDNSLREQKVCVANIEQQLKMHNLQARYLKQAKTKLNVTNGRCSKRMDWLTNVLLDTNRKEAEIMIRLRNLKADKCDELITQHNERSVEISNLFFYQSKILHQTSKQVEHFQRETASLEKLISNHCQQMKAALNKKRDVIARINSEEKSLVVLTERNRRKITAENLLRIRANNLKNTLSKNNRWVYILQTKNMEINLVARKYDLEMQSASNLLRIRKHLTRQEISNIKYRIEQTNKRIFQHMKRYAIITDSLGKDDLGVPLNVTNYKIQMAKDRYVLLEKGDHLDACVRKAEKEIQAMENTLTLLKISNNACEANFSSAINNGEKFNIYKQMKEEKFQLSTNMRTHELMASKLEREKAELLHKLSNEFNSKLRRLEDKKEEKLTDFTRLQNRVYEQGNMIHRVRSRIKCTKKLLKTHDPNIVLTEREFLSKELLEVNKVILQCITRMVSQHDEIESYIRHYLSKKGLSLPSTILVESQGKKKDTNK